MVTAAASAGQTAVWTILGIYLTITFWFLVRQIWVSLSRQVQKYKAKKHYAECQSKVIAEYARRQMVARQRVALARADSIVESVGMRDGEYREMDVAS